MDDAVWHEFRRTSIRVTLPTGTFDVEPVADRTPGRFLPGTIGPIHVLTAWNPQGLAVDEHENRVANERLGVELQADRRLRVWPVTGYGGGPLGDEGTWHEEGFGIEGLTRDEAVTLATAYDQRAIFEWHDAPGGFRLVACDGSADEPRGWHAHFEAGD